MMNTSLAGHQQLLTLAQAEEILAPYRERLNRCIEHGWEAWKKDYSHKRHLLGARARAAIVFDEIVHCAMAEFPETADLKVNRTASTFMLYIGDSIVLRFKKIRRNGRCNNILTKQQILFRAQEIVQFRLPTMEHGTLVHAGYQLDALQQEILKKRVVCQLNNSVLWQMSLAPENVPVVEVASTPQAPNTSPRFEPKPELVPQVLAASGEEK